MQTGDRLSYYPERADAELKHFHELLPKAAAAVAQVGATFAAKLNAVAPRLGSSAAEIAAQKLKRLDSLVRAEVQTTQATNRQ